MTLTCLKNPNKINLPKRILVTGGTGFIGSHLCLKLYNDGYEVIITGKEEERNTKFHKFLKTNINEIDCKEIGKIDICFHQAANNNTTDKDRDGMIRVNVDYPKELFKKLAENGCKKFIYASSSAVYGNSLIPFKENSTILNPLNHYAESKMLFEEFVHKEFIKQYPVVAIGLRYTNVYGIGEEHKNKRASMIYQIAKKAINNDEILLFEDGKQKRDWVYIKDVVAMNIKSIQLKESDIFNCGSGESVTFNHLIKLIEYNLKCKINLKYIDCPFKESYQNSTLACMEKAKEKLNFMPKNKIKDGIEKLLKEIKK